MVGLSIKRPYQRQQTSYKKLKREKKTMDKQKEAIEEKLSSIISEEAANELAALEGMDLLEVYGSMVEQVHHKKLLAAEPTVKELLNDLGSIIFEIMTLEEGEKYPKSIMDNNGTESAFEHAKTLAGFALESFLYPVTEQLGYEIEGMEPVKEFSKEDNLDMYLGLIKETLADLRKDFELGKTDDELFSKISDMEDFVHDFKLTLEPKEEKYINSMR